VHAVVGDFDHHLGSIPQEGRRLIAFLGSTIGNFGPAGRKQFFTELANGMRPGDSLLLGTDLVKDIARLEAAYDDARGVTAAFNLNVLRVVNRELGADFDLSAFTHRAFFDTDEEWIEMRLVSKRDQVVELAELGMQVEFDADEEMRTEISAKFRPAGIEAELAAVGLRLERWMTDPAGDFALALAVAD
jgi:L-histidine N-alpha-methyltransferase